jgi:uncharacterized protein
MSKSIQIGVKRLLASRLPALRSLDISWFGGEPLVATDIIEEICGFVADRSKHIDFSSNITTNGYLMSPPTFQSLVGLGVTRWQISLDGDENEHNKTRVLANGRGTFRTIWGNLVSAKNCDLNFEVILRVHFHPGNLKSCKEIISRIADTFAGDPRFKVYLKNLSHLGSKNDEDFAVFDWPAAKRTQAELSMLLSEENIWSGVGAFDQMYVCYAAQPNSLAIRSDGTIAKCTVALNSDQNRVGRLSEDGRVHLDSEKMKYWVRGFKSLKKSELACPMRTAT